MLFEGNKRFYIAGNAWVLGASKPGITVEAASSEWASAHIIKNEANSYILGRFVEADRANNNKQYFRLGELLAAQPTIANSPLNINHQSSPIGSFIASEMQYPKDSEDNPYVEALAAMWKHYYPEAYDAVQQAFAENALFFSMEAVPQTISTIGGTDDTAQYAYEGRQSPNYPTEINERSCEAIVLNNPHFVGGALIVPPARPGWSKADVKQVSAFVNQQWEQAEQIYNHVSDATPHLDPKTWEAIMGELILVGLDEIAAQTKNTKELQGEVR